MKWQPFLALCGPVQALAGLEPIGEPVWNDGVICYTYLSTYLVPVFAETAQPEFPTVPSFPTRGIIPPYFSNRSTTVPPSAVTEASEVDEKPATVIDITTSDFAIPTDDEDPVATATGSGSLFPPTPVTSTEASATSSEAASGQAVIFFVSPRTGDQKRDIVRRAPGGFIGGDSTNVDICTNAGTFRLAAGQLFDLQDPIYYDGEPYKEFRSQGTPPAGAVTRQFSDAAGTLLFANRALPNNSAGFCQEEDSGQLYITFTSSPPGCVPVSLRVYAIDQCQDGRIIGLDPVESATAETTNTASSETVTFPEDSSSTDLTGQTSSAQLSQSTDPTRSLDTTESSTADEAITATSDSSSEDPSSFPSFSTSSPSTETPLSFTTSIDTSIASKSFTSLSSSFTRTASSDSFSSEDTLSSEPTSSESVITSQVPTTITEESTTVTEELTTTTEEPTTTTEEPTTTMTTGCNSEVPLTTVALANPTPVFSGDTYRDNDFASIIVPWDGGLAETSQSQVFINTNGYITVDAGNTNPENSELPTDTVVNRAFLPYWDDLVLDPSKGHTIVYEIFEGRFGVELVIEFILGKADSPGIYHFEANFLRDQAESVRFQYYTTPEKGSSATAGFQNLLTGRNAQVSYNQEDVLVDGASIILVTGLSDTIIPVSFDNTECGKGQDRIP